MNQILRKRSVKSCLMHQAMVEAHRLWVMEVEVDCALAGHWLLVPQAAKQMAVERWAARGSYHLEESVADFHHQSYLLHAWEVEDLAADQAD
jgi:hypothetical protein